MYIQVLVSVRLRAITIAKFESLVLHGVVSRSVIICSKVSVNLNNISYFKCMEENVCLQWSRIKRVKEICHVSVWMCVTVIIFFYVIMNLQVNCDI